MKRLHTEIQVEANPAEVWAVLTDFEHYPDWNPFLVEVTGVPEEGERPERHPRSLPVGDGSPSDPTSPRCGPARSWSGGGISVRAASSTAGTGSSCTPAGPAPVWCTRRPSPGCWCRSWREAWIAGRPPGSRR